MHARWLLPVVVSLLYDSQQRTKVNTVTAGLLRDGVREALSLAAGDELRGPYGLLTGTLGALRFEGWYAREYVLHDQYDRQGAIFGRVVGADPAIELVAASYDRGEILGGHVFRRVDCSAPGAMQRNYFKF